MRALCIAGFLVACSSPSPASDGSTAPDGDVETGSDAGSDGNVISCTFPDNNGAPNVTIFKKTMTAPTPQGGAINPGLYQLTAYNYYYNTTGSDCCARVAMRVTENEILQSAFYTSSGASKKAVTYVVNGAMLATTAVCGTLSGNAGDWPFTAVGDTLTVYSNSGGIDELIFTRTGP